MKVEKSVNWWTDSGDSRGKRLARHELNNTLTKFHGMVGFWLSFYPARMSTLYVGGVIGN